MTDISIITLNFNREKVLDKWFEAWYMFQRNFDYEIILLDNGSDPKNFKAFYERWSHKKEIRWVELGQNYGFGFPHTEIAPYCKGEYLVFSNPDTLIYENGIIDLVGFLKSNPDVGIVGAQLFGENTPVHDSYRSFMKPFDWLLKRLKPLHRLKFVQNRLREFLMWNMDNTKIQTVDWIQGSSMVMRKQDFLDLGGFDKRFFIFAEDMDLCRKVWNSGKKVVYYPKVRWFHGDKRGSSSGSVFKDLFKKTAWWHLSSLLKYFLKWGPFTPKINHKIYN